MTNSVKKSSKLNYTYNLIYQIFVLITPLITTPYVSRVLGSDGLGQYAFSIALISYFIIFASMGFSIYSQREIARYQNDKHKQSVIFWELMIGRSIFVSIALIAEVIMIFCGVFGDYTLLMEILSINIFAVFFDILFFYQGNEDFDMIVIRNIIIKILGITLIFVFVKNQNDLWIYTLCSSLVLIVSNCSLWFGIHKRLDKVKNDEIHFKRHLLPMFRLFLPTIAVSIYTIMDKTFIGLIVPGTIVNNLADGTTEIVKVADIENGYYLQSQKIVTMALTVVTSLGTVMTPRNSHEIATGNIKGFLSNIYKALRFVMFIGIPIMFGLIAVSQNICPWFFGDGYDKVPYLIMIFSPLILIIGLSNVLGLQYLIPKGKDKRYTIAICIGAGINLIFNSFLIFLFYSYGAAIASVISELCVTGVMLYITRKDISIVKLLKSSWKYILSGLIMFGVVYFTQTFFAAKIYYSIILIVEGIVVYFGLLYLFKDQFYLDIIAIIRKKLSRKIKK